MGYYSRLSQSFEGALRLPLMDGSHYVLISDCHRGVGNSNDNFLKNQNLYFAALQYYYKMGYTYIELGDGDELWENRSFKQIMQTHNNIFCLLSLFQQQNRLYMLYGNHDMIKKKNDPSIFPDMTFYSGIILENTPSHHTYNSKNDTTNTINTSLDIYITHGHQTDLFNSTLWRLSRFLVRYLWKPLERFGILDPTSAAKNYKRKRRTEELLHHWAQQENHILITGHTHRPTLSETDRYYYNSGSCVHPQGITCLEIEHKRIRLVKWAFSTRPDMTLFVSREILAGPVSLER